MLLKSKMRISLISLIVFVKYSISKSHSNIYWTNITESTAMVVKLDPAGLLDGTNELYACKMWADNRWITGSFFFTSDYNVSKCTVVTHKRVYKTKDFQVLIYPPGSISWIPYESWKFPENAIEGGTHRNGDFGYVCRARWNNSLLVGISYKTTCYMPRGDKEVDVGKRIGIDILTESRFGILFDETFPRT